MDPSATAQHPIKRVKPTGPNDPIWEHVKPTVSRVYWDEDCSLKRTMEVVAAEYNFTATKKQWTDKLNYWNLKKNVSSEEMRNIARVRQKRRTEQDKETRFKVRGRPVAMENLERWQKRQKLNNGGFVDVPSWADAVTIPSEISYETPSEAESVPSRSGTPTPPDVSEDSDTQSNSNHAALALVDFFHAQPDDTSFFSNLLDMASVSEMSPATSGPIDPVINTPKAGSPAASEREATPIQSSCQTPMIMEVDNVYQAFHQTNDVDLLDEEDPRCDGSGVLEVLHDEMNLGDLESDIRSVIMIQEQDYDEAVDNLRPDLMSLAVPDETMDTGLPTFLFPEFDPDGPFSMVSLEAHSLSRGRDSDITANAMGFDSVADPIVAVAPCNDEDSRHTDDQPPRRSSVQANDPKTEATALLNYGQRHPRSMTEETALIDGIPKDAELDNTESLSDDSSVAEIDLDDMKYSSDSSDSSIESIDAQGYNFAIRLSQAAPNRALLFSQETMAQEMKDRTLRAAARAGDTHSVQRLIVKGADIHSRSRSGMMALHTAALHAHPQVVGLLLQLGSDVDKIVRGSVEIPYKFSDTRSIETLENPDCLQLACSRGHQDVVALLLSYLPSGIDNALFYAAFFGVDPILRMLVDWGNETNRLTGKAKRRALYQPTLHEYWTTVELLLSEVDSYDDVELGAVLMGEIDIVKVVIDASGGDLDYRNYSGYTPLTMAVSVNRRNIVKLLLESGASIEYRSAYGDTGLTLAMLQGLTDVVELLLSRGAV